DEDYFSDWHHGFVIDGKLTDITRLQVCRLYHLGIEFEPAALIFRISIGPVPLLAGHLHRDVRRRYRQLMGEQTKRWNSDHDEYHDRHHGPGHFEAGMMAYLRGDRIGLLVEPKNDVNQ